MTDKNLFNDMIAASPNRRNFVKKLGLAGAVAGAVAATSNSLDAQSSGPSDADILNFALNLEYLEAEFYTVATTGKTISQIGLTVSGTGASGATTGGSMVNFTDPITQAVALELANDEQTHVSLIQGALLAAGAQPIAKPAINLNALGLGFGSQNDFLILARIFEDIGVTAYGGAAPLISNKAILGYAARILAVEAFHSGNIRQQMARYGITGKPLDGADHAPPPFGTLYFNTDNNALSEIRTPQQVLYLAFGAANATSGAFFPSGVNGLLNTSSAAPAASDGATLTVNPNPIPVTGGALGQTTVSWNAPTAQIIQVRVGSVGGNLLTQNFNSGSMMTGAWVTDGLTFYLQDVSGGKNVTLATAAAHLMKM